jgi:hypothetical protein
MFQIQSQQLTNDNPNATFTFPAPVGAYVYGISGFRMTLEPPPSIFSGGFSLNTVSINLKPTFSSDNLVLNLTATFSMTGSDIPFTGTVQITVLAWVGSENPPGIFLVNQMGIGSGDSPAPVALNGSPVVAVGILSGFNFSLNDPSGQIVGLGAASGCTLSPYYAEGIAAVPTGEGILIPDNSDNSDSSPSSNTVDTGLVILTQAQENCATGMYFDNNSQAGSYSSMVTTQGLTPTQVAVFLQSFYLQFQIVSNSSSTPEVSDIEVGASSIMPTGGGFYFLSTRNLLWKIFVPGTEETVATANSLAATYFYIALAAPSASAISPTSGDTAGGTQVTLTGENFSDGAVVYFGNTEATNVQVTSTTELSATVPPAVSAGTVDVYVATNAGVSQGLSFDYELGVPSVTAVTPNYGSMSGGTVVSIEGSGLASNGDLAITEVMFGSVAATGLSYDAATQTLAATSPAATAAELVDIVVSNAAGSSAKNYNDHFSYSTTSDIVAERVEKEDKKS